MAKKHWSRPTKQERGWLDAVLNPPLEPAPHACGKCRNPFTGGREDCPNNRRST